MPDPATTIPDLAGTLAELDAMQEAGGPELPIVGLDLDDGDPEPDPFDYVPVTAWRDFRDLLVGALATLATDQYLILSTRAIDGRSDYYVQFAQMGQAGFRAEAVSNAYLPGRAQLPTAIEGAVPTLGWQAPRRVKGRPENFHREWPPYHIPYGTIAALAVRTLREIYAVSSPGELRYRRFCREGGPDIPTMLGIAPERSPRQPAAEAAEAARDERSEVSHDRSRPADPHDAMAEAVEDWLTPLRIQGDASRTGPQSWRRTVDGETLFLRILPGPVPILRFFTPILTAPATPELMVAVNELNTEFHFARALYVNGEVFISLEVPSDDLEEPALENASAMVRALARQATIELAAFAPRPGSAPAAAAELLN